MDRKEILNNKIKLVDLISERNITEYSDFLNYVKENGTEDEYNVAVKQKDFFNTFIKVRVPKKTSKDEIFNIINNYYMEKSNNSVKSDLENKEKKRQSLIVQLGEIIDKDTMQELVKDLEKEYQEQTEELGKIKTKK